MGDQYAERRAYVRHAIRVPVAVRPRSGLAQFLSMVADLSEGGVSFSSPALLAVGSAVDVELPVHHTRFTLSGTVASCFELEDRSFRIGLSFVETGMSFKMKLAEQVLRIADLQAELSRQRGVVVSRAEASQIWVEHYADTFADLFPT